jgi:tol-pal system protein YbgF
MRPRGATVVAAGMLACAACGTQYDQQRVQRTDDLRSLVVEQGEAIDDLRREQSRLRSQVEELQHRQQSAGAAAYGTPAGYAGEASAGYGQAAAPVSAGEYTPAASAAAAAVVPGMETGGADAGASAAAMAADGQVGAAAADVPAMVTGPVVMAPGVDSPQAGVGAATPVAEAGSVGGPIPDVPEDLAGTDYDAGVRAMVAGDYDAAIQSFRDFIYENPSSGYADDAQFWIGEGYFRKQQYHRSIYEFNQVVTAYGSGDQASLALLRQAEAFKLVGDRVDARLSLQKVINRYPGTPEADRAAAMLSEIGG